MPSTLNDESPMPGSDGAIDLGGGLLAVSLLCDKPHPSLCYSQDLVSLNKMIFEELCWRHVGLEELNLKPSIPCMELGKVVELLGTSVFPSVA